MRPFFLFFFFLPERFVSCPEMNETWKRTSTGRSRWVAAERTSFFPPFSFIMQHIYNIIQTFNQEHLRPGRFYLEQGIGTLLPAPDAAQPSDGACTAARTGVKVYELRSPEAVHSPRLEPSVCSVVACTCAQGRRRLLSVFSLNSLGGFLESPAWIWKRQISRASCVCARWPAWWEERKETLFYICCLFYHWPTLVLQSHRDKLAYE